MRISWTKSLLFAALSLMVFACGNRTELLEPPWGEPADSGQGGSSAKGGSGGSAAAAGKGGTGGVAGQGGSGGSSTSDACPAFCSKCSGSLPNCASQCAQAKALIPTSCLTYFNDYLLCSAANGCNQYSCQAELNAVNQCMGSVSPDAGH